MYKLFQINDYVGKLEEYQLYLTEGNYPVGPCVARSVDIDDIVSQLNKMINAATQLPLVWKDGRWIAESADIDNK